jgi:ADP-ribosyl-[dinitrogen reductase] hydrolase
MSAGREALDYFRAEDHAQVVDQTHGRCAAQRQAIIGCLLGTAVGDAMGLAYEGLSKRRQQRLFPEFSKPNFLFGRIMASDDTEHACMAAQALIVSAGEPKRFARSLAWRLRLWLLGLPAGIGLATLRSIVKLWIGFSPDHSGVFSAGNGPAMRSAIIGVCCGRRTEALRALVHASTCVTHSDPKAEHGALAVALAASFAAEGDHDHNRYCREVQELLGTDGQELIELVRKAAESADRGVTTDEFAATIGLSHGVSGYVNHTVPIALHAWFRHPTDYRTAVLGTIRCGGDTDTVAAIAGAIIGAGVGRGGIPEEWLNALFEWPRTVSWIDNLGRRLAEVRADGVPRKAVGVPFYAIPLRNALFAGVVLIHGLRRLLPPY